MKEYIERSSVMDALQDIPSGCIGEPCNVGLRYARAQIAAIPAADVVEVRHGRWIPSDMGGGEPDEAYICSECGEPWILIDGTPAENNMRYCPACGCRMDKEDEHEAG